MGLRARRRDDAGRAATIASDCDDRTGNGRGNVAARFRHRRWLADATAVGDFCDRWNLDLDGAVAGDYADDLLSADSEDAIHHRDTEGAGSSGVVIPGRSVKAAVRHYSPSR